MRRLYPEELVSLARGLLERPDVVPSLRVRSAALLARQALEKLLAEVWRTRAPGTEDISFRAQLICLPDYLRDEELARRITLAFWALSQACHHHAYELSPDPSELRHWIDVVTAFAERTR